MGVRLSRLPDFLDKWDVDFKLLDGWQDRSRASGDFVDVMGVIVHHTATSITVERDLGWQYTNSPDRPIGNGLLARDGVFHLGAVRATNTAGKGGPYLTSRGVIPLDSANSRTFNIEAQNNGVGEPWTAAMVATYPRLCAAVIDCVNSTTPGSKLGAGDVLSHLEWAPTRKIDPAGPSPWCNTDDRYMRWFMDDFRGSVFAALMAGPPVVEIPQPPDSDEDDDMATMYLLRGPSGQMWASDRRTVAYRVDDGDMGAMLRDERGFLCQPDKNPWPCSATEEAHLARMAG